MDEKGNLLCSSEPLSFSLPILTNSSTSSNCPLNKGSPLPNILALQNTFPALSGHHYPNLSSLMPLYSCLSSLLCLLLRLLTFSPFVFATFICSSCSLHLHIKMLMPFCLSAQYSPAPSLCPCLLPVFTVFLKDSHRNWGKTSKREMVLRGFLTPTCYFIFRMKQGH